MPTIATRSIRAQSPGTPEVFLGAYGKHPGWNDHIDDIGLETEAMIALKRVLYVEGIGAAIDSGAWDKLEDPQRIDGFEHLLLWRVPGEVVLCRLWSSVDGKGRTKYPMVVSAHCRGTGLDWALANVLPSLEEARRLCAQMTTAEQVRAELDRLRSSLRAGVAALDGARPETASARVIAQVADRPEMAPEGRGVHRILYQIEREMADYAPAGSEIAAAAGGSRSRIGELRPQHIRVPACADSPGAALGQWVQFMLCLLDPGVPLTAIAPIGREWVDLVVGDLDGAQCFCLRASPKSVPLATEIPYTLDPDFVARCRRRIESSRSGAASPVQLAASAKKQGVLSSFASRLTGRKKTYLLLVAVGAVAAALAGAAWYMWAGEAGAGSGTARAHSSPVDIRPPPPSPESASKVGGGVGGGIAPTGGAGDEWQRLCTDYLAWYGLFLKRLDEKPRIDLPGGPFPSRRAAYATDAHLASIIGRLGGESGVPGLDPWAIAGVERGADLEVLARSPPEAATSADGKRRTALAASQVQGVADGLSAQAWPLLGTIAGAGDALQAGGRGAEAELARQLVRAVTSRSSADVAAGIDEVLARGPVFRRIADNLKTLERTSATLAGTGDAVLAKFDGWAARQIEMSSSAAARPPAGATRADSAALLAFDRRLEETAGLAFRLGAFVAEDWAKTDRVMLSGRSPAYAGAGAPSAETFEQWLRDARACPVLDAAADPRRSSPARAALVEIAARLDTLSTTLSVEPDAGATQRHAALAVRLEELDKLAYNAATRAEIESGLAEIQTRADELRQLLSNQIALEQARRAGSAREVKERLSATPTIVARSEAINSAWRAARDRLLAGFPDEQYPQLRLKAEEVQRALTALDAGVPAGLEAAGETGPWAGAIARESWAQRERAIEQGLSAWRSGAGIPEPGGLPPAQTVAAGFVQWLPSAQTLIADVWAIRRMLDAGFGLREQGEDAATIDSLYRSASQAPAAAAPDIATAIAPVFDRVRALRDLESGQAEAALAALLSATSDRPEAAVGAWRRLGALPAWPGSVPQLADAARADEAFVRAIAPLVPERRAALERELAHERPARWQRCFARLTAPADIESAAAQSAAFGVEPGSLPPALRYNLMLADFKHRAAGAQTDEQVSELTRSFLKAIGPPDGPPQASVRAFLTSLGTITGDAPPAKPAIDATRLGPGSKEGWSGKVDGNAVRFTRAGAPPRGPTTLDFVRIDGAGLGGAGQEFFIGATEIPVGVFIEVIDGAGAWNALASVFPDVSTGQDYRQGPRTWRWGLDAQRRTVMRLAPTWLTQLATGRAVPESPRELNAGGGGRPAAQHPIQFIPPDAALLMATLVGCRLPTSAEWHAALGSVKTSGVPNLRDRTWGRQQQHCASLAGGGPVQWPDANMVLPAKVGKVPRAENATAGDSDDGTLWFTPVDSGDGPGVHHLIGNVAEFLLETPPPLTLQPGGIRAFLRERKADLRVVGGSAISPKEVVTTEAYFIDLEEATEGFSDVGFRLAFSARGSAPAPEPLAARLARLLADAPYLVAP